MMMQDDTDDNQRVSKSEKKRESARIIEFAFKLSKIVEKKVPRLKLPEEIEIELLKAMKLKSQGAKGRQLKYVGGLIRSHELCKEIIAIDLKHI